MKLLQLCLAAAIAAGVMAVPHVAGAQALGAAATLGAGVSSAGSASGSALGHSLNRAIRSEGRRVHSSSSSSNSGGVTNLHCSREELERSAKTTRKQAKRKNAKSGKGKPQPEFVIFGADPPNADSDDAPVIQPKAAQPSKSQPRSRPSQPKASRDKSSSRPGEKKVSPAGH